MIDNQAQDAKISGIGHGKCPDIDVVGCQNRGDLSQAADLFSRKTAICSTCMVPPE